MSHFISFCLFYSFNTFRRREHQIFKLCPHSLSLPLSFLLSPRGERRSLGLSGRESKRGTGTCLDWLILIMDGLGPKIFMRLRFQNRILEFLNFPLPSDCLPACLTHWWEVRCGYIIAKPQNLWNKCGVKVSSVQKEFHKTFLMNFHLKEST